MAENNPLQGDNSVTEENDCWKIFKSKGTFDVDVEIANHEQLEIFSGSVKRVLPINDVLPSDKGRSKILLSAVRPTTFSINQPSLSSIHVPEAMLTSNSFPGIMFGLSRNIGISLYDWVGTHCREIWDYKTAPNHARFEESVRMVGRWFCAALFQHHDAGQYVVNPLESAFVQEEKERIVFYSDSVKTKVAEVGIQDNLKDLVRFVIWLEKLKPMNRRPLEVDLFLKLYPVKLPSLMDDLKTLSYFMCHAPIFWGYKQRDSFCFMYWRERNKDIFTFDMMTRLLGDTLIPTNWDQQLPLNQSDPLVKVHLFLRSTYISGGAHSLISFHRNCKIHYNDYVKKMCSLSFEEIDQRLFRCFPDALPKAYIALWRSWRSNVKSKDDLAVLLRSGPHGIDYLKSTKG